MINVFWCKPNKSLLANLLLGLHQNTRRISYEEKTA